MGHNQRGVDADRPAVRGGDDRPDHDCAAFNSLCGLNESLESAQKATKKPNLGLALALAFATPRAPETGGSASDRGQSPLEPEKTKGRQQ
jgi:hypothetical protein